MDGNSGNSSKKQTASDRARSSESFLRACHSQTKGQSSSSQHHLPFPGTVALEFGFDLLFWPHQADQGQSLSTFMLPCPYETDIIGQDFWYQCFYSDANTGKCAGRENTSFCVHRMNHSVEEETVSRNKYSKFFPSGFHFLTLLHWRNKPSLMCFPCLGLPDPSVNPLDYFFSKLFDQRYVHLVPKRCPKSHIFLTVMRTLNIITCILSFKGKIINKYSFINK